MLRGTFSSPSAMRFTIAGVDGTLETTIIHLLNFACVCFCSSAQSEKKGQRVGLYLGILN